MKHFWEIFINSKKDLQDRTPRFIFIFSNKFFFFFFKNNFFKESLC